MFTHGYHGGWVHGYFDRAECYAQITPGQFLGLFKSYRAAQLAITRAKRGA